MQLNVLISFVTMIINFSIKIYFHKTTEIQQIENSTLLCFDTSKCNYYTYLIVLLPIIRTDKYIGCRSLKKNQNRFQKLE